MKIEYTCEVCGKRFPSRTEAELCEREHQIKDKRDDLKRKSSEAISTLCNKHIKEFREHPEIELSKESLDILAGENHSVLAAVLNELLMELKNLENEEEEE